MFNMIFFIVMFLFLNTECWSAFLRNRCSTIRVDNGRVRTRHMGQVARIYCNLNFKLVHGNEFMNCVGGEWDSEPPICARTGCPIVEKITHGILNVVYGGAKLEVKCNLGYSIDGPSFVYCNEYMEWNDELRGCKEDDQIYLLCDFESSDERFCGWKNDIYNDVDWLADKMTFFPFNRIRHVPSGSSQYFSSNNYISLDAGNYGSSTAGRLISPPLLPFRTKQRCLIFSYKVISGSSYGPHILKVSYGGIPHWETSKGEGKVIIGLYKFNVTSNVIIEGKSCRVAIDDLIIADGDVCIQRPYEEEIDSCHDNCGKIVPKWSNYDGCSCDWDCYNDNNCCPDLNLQCPYIKPLEDIARLYLPTRAATFTPKPNIIKSSTLNIPVSSLKIINETKTSNDLILETTPMNDHNVTMNSTIASNITQSIQMSNITYYPTIPFTPPLTSTVKPITITLTISSTPTSTEIPKFNNSSSINSSLINYSSFTYSTLKQFMTVPDNTVTNIIPTTPKTIDKPGTLTKIIKTNTIVSIPAVFNVPSSTSKSDSINTTISYYTKLINKSDINVKFVFTNKTINATTLSSIASSTIKPFTKKSTNLSTVIQELLTKDKSNDFELLNNYTTTFITATTSILQRTIQNIVSSENKSTILNDIPTPTPHIVKNLNQSTISEHKMIDVNIFHPNSNSVPSNYSTTPENKNVPSLINLDQYFKTTKVKISYKKPGLNDSLDNTKNKKAKSSGMIVDIVSIVKYIAVIGVILITTKFTMSYIRWYLKKPTRDEMNACFITTDKESNYNIELA